MRLGAGVAQGALPWAIIPTAGNGTRLRPATDSVPKALLPVGLRPMLDWALDEALETDVSAVVLVVSPGLSLVRQHAERRAAEPGWPGNVELQFVEQPSPLGLGDALIRCRPLTGGDSFGVVVPDNWFDAPVPALAQVAETHFRTGLDTLGLVSVERRRAALLGNVGRVELERLADDDYAIRNLGDKKAGTFRVEGQSPVLRGCARYVLGASFYEALEATGPPEDGEWDDVPAFQYLARNGALAGRRLEAVHFDVGQPAGYLGAMSYLFETRVNGTGA